MWCVLVKLQYWESVIKLSDNICETAVQLSVHILCKYGGYCCMCHGDNIACCASKKSVLLLQYMWYFIEMHQSLKSHGFFIECSRYSLLNLWLSSQEEDFCIADCICGVKFLSNKILEDEFWTNMTNENFVMFELDDVALTEVKNAYR